MAEYRKIAYNSCWSNRQHSLNRKGLKDITALISNIELKPPCIPYTRLPFFDELLDINNKIWNIRYGKGDTILEYKWDNLILLDACRYDEFLRVSPYPFNQVNPRITLGSRTSEFLHRTFNNHQLYDTVYITANPVVTAFEYKNDTNQPTFHSIISLLDEWDSEIQTIHPEIVTQSAIETESEYPDKRLIIHYLQPHAPFIGEKATELRERTGKTIGGLDPELEFVERNTKNINTLSYNEAINSDDIHITHSEIITAYRESLEIVLSHADELVSTLNGKTAITSDHGELLYDSILPFGRRFWSHPKDLRTTELCKVPWVEFEPECRKETIAEKPQKSANVDARRVNKHLKALGYK